MEALVECATDLPLDVLCRRLLEVVMLGTMRMSPALRVFDLPLRLCVPRLECDAKTFLFELAHVVVQLRAGGCVYSRVVLHAADDLQPEIAKVLATVATFVASNQMPRGKLPLLAIERPTKSVLYRVKADGQGLYTGKWAGIDAKPHNASSARLSDGDADARQCAEPVRIVYETRRAVRMRDLSVDTVTGIAKIENFDALAAALAKPGCRTTSVFVDLGVAHVLCATPYAVRWLVHRDGQPPLEFLPAGRPYE